MAHHTKLLAHPPRSQKWRRGWPNQGSLPGRWWWTRRLEMFRLASTLLQPLIDQTSWIRATLGRISNFFVICPRRSKMKAHTPTPAYH